MTIKILFVILFLLNPILLFAHSGRTNAQGCHNNRKTGGYHCHNSKYSTPSKRDVHLTKKSFPKEVIVGSESVNFRLEPAGKEDSLYASSGTKLKVIDAKIINKIKWFKVRFRGKTGWVEESEIVQ